MWPFSQPDITKDIPPELRAVFDENNPRPQAGADHQARVEAVLANHDTYSFDLQQYKQHNTLPRVASINCAEIQHAVSTCFQGWSLTDTDPCSTLVKNLSKCVEIQQDALKKLHYHQCYSEKQCGQIRRLVDELFVRNFGQMGDNVTEELKLVFDAEVNKYFEKVWR